MTGCAIWASPLGTITARSEADKVVALGFDEVAQNLQIRPVLEQLGKDLTAFFAGELRQFNVAFQAEGSAFERQVWEAVARIPFGETRSYLQIAEALGNPGASRAVGKANGKNPVLLLLPCHRVIGSTGSLTGYAGGMERKRFLLTHEQKVAGKVLF